jgi:hypothetical protein
MKGKKTRGAIEIATHGALPRLRGRPSRAAFTPVAVPPEVFGVRGRHIYSPAAAGFSLRSGRLKKAFSARGATEKGVHAKKPPPIP